MTGECRLYCGTVSLYCRHCCHCPHCYAFPANSRKKSEILWDWHLYMWSHITTVTSATVRTYLELLSLPISTSKLLIVCCASSKFCCSSTFWSFMVSNEAFDLLMAASWSYVHAHVQRLVQLHTYFQLCVFLL